MALLMKTFAALALAMSGLIALMAIESVRDLVITLGIVAFFLLIWFGTAEIIRDKNLTKGRP